MIETILLITLWILLGGISTILNIGMLRGGSKKDFDYNNMYKELEREDKGFGVLFGFGVPIFSTIVIFCLSGFAEGGLRFD